jgi:hypothetical protein
MFPMKFFEYLSSGLAVVATAIPALEAHADVAWLCPPEAEAFEQAIQAALAGQGPSLQQRLERAATQTYEVRTASMLAYLDRVGLLAEAHRNQSEPEGFHPSLLERIAAEATGVFSRGLVKISHSLMRAGHPRLAVSFLEGLAIRGWRDCTLEGGLVLPLVRCGDYHQARLVMERLWQRYGHVGELKQLLFRRGNRPSERSEQVLLFEELVTSTVLPLYALNYCQVVLAHRCVDVNDGRRMRQSVDAIELMAAELEADPGTGLCLRSNRRNRTKLLVSCYATLLRLQLGLADGVALASLGQRCLAFFERLDLDCIDPDTSYRLTRNALRVLLINVLEAWGRTDQALLQRVQLQIERLNAHCHQARFDQQCAQENHRGYAESVVALVQQVQVAMAEGRLAPKEPLQSLMLLMIRSERELATASIREEHLQTVLPLFAPHWPMASR